MTRLTKEFLEHEYITLRKTARQIANETGYLPSTIYQNTHKYKLKKTKSDKVYRTDIDKSKYPSKEILFQLHKIDKQTSGEIGYRFGLGPWTIQRLLKEYGIPANKPNKYDIIDRTFGKLTVKKYIDTIKQGNKLKNRYLCQCECGKEKICFSQRLLDNRNISCGCSINDKRIYNGKFKGCGDISGRFWCRIRSNAKKRNLKIEFTIEDIWGLYIKQNKKCKLTGLEIGFDRNTNQYIASLDRIDSSKGYILENVQWVCSKINLMKRNYTEKSFISFCKLVAQHNV